MVWLVLSYYHCNQSGICKRFEITASEDSVLLELVELLTTPPSFSSTPPHPSPALPTHLFYEHTYFSHARTSISTMKHTHWAHRHTKPCIHRHTHTAPLMFVCQAVCLFYLPTYPPPTPHLPPLLSTPNPLHVLVVLVVGCMEKAASKSFFSTRWKK